MPIEKTDAHHHLWSLASPHYPMLHAPDAERFMGNTGRLKHEFGADEFAPLLAAQNVTRTVHVEAHYDPPTQETAMLDAFADRYGFPHAIIARVDLASPTLEGDLALHQRSPRFRGVRVMVNWDTDSRLCASAEPHRLRDPAWQAGYKLLGTLGLSAEVMALPAQLTDLADLAASAPHTALVVGHTGMPLCRTPAEHATWQHGMAALAALPHVTAKISGLGMADHHWTQDSIAPLVLETIDRFGPDRCMFGSNFPVDRLYSSYDDLWNAFDAITADLPDDDRAALFRNTANRFYNLD